MAKDRIRERASELRKRAEKILAEEPQPIRTMVPADIQKLIYELNVHQIELEMQNAELRHVQLELQEARDKYLNLYDFAPTGYFTLDHNSLIVDVNLAGSELLGSEKHRLIGAQFTSSISPDSQDAFYLHYREVLKTGIKGNCEFKMLKADGTPFHAQLISMVVPEKDANINQCRTAVIDISERKRIEKRLWDSMSNFHKVVHNNADGIIITNREGIVRYVNPAAESLFCRTSEDFNGEQFDFPITLSDVTEVDITRQAGDIVVAEMCAAETMWYDEFAHLISLHDITGRRQAEEALLESEERFRSIVENSHDGIVILDDAYRVIYVNDKLCQMSGYSHEEVIGQDFRKFLDEESKQLLAERYIRRQRGEEVPPRYEFNIVRKDGQKRRVEISSSVIKDSAGKVKTVAQILDITERKKAQQARERLSQQLQAKVSELETFSYGIAHDLRSPLVSIEGFSRLLREDIQNQKVENVQEDIRLLESGVRKMQQFLNRTLEYSRAGQLVNQATNISFGKIVNEAITEFNGQISSIGAAVSRADKFPRVYADKVRIAEVLTNLIQNSIKYRDKTVPLKIEVGHYPSGNEIVFFVRDNGTGIEESETEKVFDLFYRGSTEGEGSGTGLAIVKKIIEAHGGRIWVQQGQAGKGTTMCFTLPRQHGTKKDNNNGKD